MIRKTFVEWCRDFKTPKSNTEFWTMSNTGLHISDVSPRGNGNKNIESYNNLKTLLEEINNKNMEDQFNKSMWCNESPNPQKQCVRINSDDSNRCINCGAKVGHKCEINN